MSGMPDGRPLMVGGWPGEGVRAGDEGRLLYTETGSNLTLSALMWELKELT